MNAPAVASLRARLAAENLTSETALELAVVSIAEAEQNDIHALRRKELIQELADAAATALRNGANLDATAKKFGLDGGDAVVFVFNVGHIWRLADECGIYWYDLAYAHYEQTRLAKSNHLAPELRG
jgi:hypothetical protein